ncbi:MAG: hypothetical protein RIC15_09860 [Vicingaceae bacterium]
MFASFSSEAQMCNNYHIDKKGCPPSTDNFKLNGQSRSALMYKGQKSQLNVIFYDDQDYRISICPESILGDQVSFKIKDGKTQDVLYNNQDEDGTLIFEFSCEQTQRLILEIEVPDDGEGGGNKLSKLKSTSSGCLGVLIEYMATPRTGF